MAKLFFVHLFFGAVSDGCPLAIRWLISPIVLPLFSHRSPI
ncbi:MAG: hypothetical protein ACSW8I_01990 [bacterium]